MLRSRPKDRPRARLQEFPPAGWLNIDNDRIILLDQIGRGVSKERSPVMGAVERAAESAGEMNVGELIEQWQRAQRADVGF